MNLILHIGLKLDKLVTVPPLPLELQYLDDLKSFPMLQLENLKDSPMQVSSEMQIDQSISLNYVWILNNMILQSIKGSSSQLERIDLGRIRTNADKR